MRHYVIVLTIPTLNDMEFLENMQLGMTISGKRAHTATLRMCLVTRDYLARK